MLLTFRRCTFCCIHHCWTKTPRLSSARTFVWLYKLLLIHCIYVSVTKPTCPAFSAWLITGTITSLKLLCSVVTAFPSKLCAALHGQSQVGSMCNCKPCGSLDLSVLVEILSGVDWDHGTVPRRNGSVNSRSTLCPIERRSCWSKRSFKLSPGCLHFVNWTISSCLASQASKLYKFVAFYGVVKDRFFSYRWVSEVCNSLPANVTSLNKILSYARLSRNT